VFRVDGIIFIATGFVYLCEFIFKTFAIQKRGEELTRHILVGKAKSRFLVAALLGMTSNTGSSQKNKGRQ
jgi:hypothetical protein